VGHVDQVRFVLGADFVQRVTRGSLVFEGGVHDDVALGGLAHDCRLVALLEACGAELPQPELGELELRRSHANGHEGVAAWSRHQTSTMRAEM
jgi:hypothetical protein